MTYHFKLENPDGTPADPPTLRSVVSVWKPGDTIERGKHGKLLVTNVRDEGDEVVLVVAPEVPAGSGSTSTVKPQGST